jgi:hypothetical protein
MTRIQMIFASLLLAIAPDVFAHPGHPTLSPDHLHGPLELNPIAVILVGAIAIGVILVRRGGTRRRPKSMRISKK